MYRVLLVLLSSRLEWFTEGNVGMKEDLNMSGNQINKITTVFTCGFVHLCV